MLTSSIYVDLNQIRGGMATSLENSQHSAIRNRILAARQREAQGSHEEFTQQDPAGLYAFSAAQADALFADCWLSPIGVDGPLLTEASIPNSILHTDPAPDTNRSSPGQDTVEESADTGKRPEVALSDDSPVPNSPVPNSSVPGESDRKTPKKSMNRLVRRRASDSPILDVPTAGEPTCRGIGGGVQGRG
ncbi:MAG: hypothetical protein GY720_02085 [bacterium]|nr:hypothetical protein [bacterium]